jgi:hypothetical protein
MTSLGIKPTTFQLVALCLTHCSIQYNIVMDLIYALPGNSSVNMVQRATLEEAVFSVDPTDVPIGWLHSDHVIMCLL